MREPEPPSETDASVTAWRSEADDHPGARVKFTPDELYAMARSRRKLNAIVAAVTVVVVAALAAALLYNVYRIDRPWIRLGQAWTLAVFVYLFVPMLERKGRDAGSGEPCARFLESQHEERRRGYLRIRRRLFLFIPGIAASCWGGGAVAAANARGLDPSSWLFHFLAGPWPFVVAVSVLILVWFAFGQAAEKAARDRDEIRGSAVQPGEALSR